ncbi:XRE family transcriptional regulator [Albitalea terrae]|uniref:XRE family transcriptional regulator n=2 Tax=Piscinibacter terrae TaxID=2496871 RepID=A0A3N7JS79_9BURK|nr:XRE family transcriptional regulator [Albitalea terrae]
MAYDLWMNTDQEVELLRDWPEPQVCRYLCAKVRRARQEAGETQAGFAARACVPLRTYKRFEANGQATLATFVQVLRALGRTQYLFMLFPSAPTTTVSASLDEKLKRLRLRSMSPR